MLICKLRGENSMKVKDLVIITGGLTNIRMVGTTDKDQYVDVWKGIIDDIDFNNNLIPYGEYKIDHVTVINETDELVIIIDESINFAPLINTDVKHVMSGTSKYSLSV